jgi:Terpene cyclase DEP1
VPFGLTPLRSLWLGLAGTGAVLGWAADWPPPVGADWAGIAALAVWSLVETIVRRNWGALVTLPAFALGLGCALPLYLFLRSRRVA